MSLSRALPPVSLVAIAFGVAACNAPAEGQPSSYQAWADKVATIPLTPADDAGMSSDAPRVSLPLDPQKPDDEPKPASRMKVELVSPHQLWDLRNGPVKLPTIEVSEGGPLSVNAPVNAPAPRAAPSTSRPTGSQLIQLGAYSTQAQAQAAWQRLSSGAGGNALGGLSPRFDPVEVNGRTLIRLRVTASSQQAQSLCRSIAAADPWCQRPAG